MDSHSHLLRSLGCFSEPKVLLLGGPSLAFGVSTEVLTLALGRPVISMGIHAGQGVEYRLNEAKSFIGKDDLVILSIEYRPLNGSIAEDVIWNTVESNVWSFRYFGIKTWKTFLDQSALRGLSRSAKRLIDHLLLGEDACPKPPYTLSSFSEYGDVVGHYGMVVEREPYATSLKDYKYHENRLRHSISKINEFSTFVESRGARVFMILPSIPNGTYAASYANLWQAKRDLEAFCRVPILNSLESIATADELFYDTEYHLTESGIAKKTADWLQLLRGVIE